MKLLEIPRVKSRQRKWTNDGSTIATSTFHILIAPRIQSLIRLLGLCDRRNLQVEAKRAFARGFARG